MASFTETLSPNKTALVLIEFQNDFTTEGGKLHEAVKPVMDASNMLANTVNLVAQARAKGIKIVHVPITFSDSYKELAASPYGILGNVKAGKCFPASGWGGQFCEALTPDPDDLIVEGKRGLCGFSSTNLDFLLRQNDIDNCRSIIVVTSAE